VQHLILETGVPVWLSEVGPILVGLAGVLTAIKGLGAYGGRTQPDNHNSDLDPCLQDLEELQERHHSALRHIYRLEQFIAGYGLRPPERPESIYR
jgi:hypothetical protein